MNKKLLKSSFLGSGVKLLTISVLTSFQVFSQTPPNQQNALNASGYVGVGTTNPDSKLQVNGNMSVDSSLTVRDTAVFEKQARMKGKIIVEGDAVIKGKLTAKDNFKVLGTAKMEGNVKMTALPNANANDTSLLFINANGKITSGGIPALIDILYANPQAKNALTKLIYSEECVLVPSEPPGQNSLTGITPQEYIPVWANKVGVLWTGLPCPAKVGIGTKNPLTTLDVIGGGYFTQSVGMGIPPEANTGAIIRTNGNLGSNVYSIKAVVYHTENKALAVINASLNKEMFTLFGDGSFQFSNATQKILQLDAASGVLRSREVNVNVNTWPDYVFKQNYTLMPLSQLKQFITTNGHLPNVPSAEEVKANGVNLGNTAKITMEKVEELTLYLIQQQATIEQLQKQLQEQQKSILELNGKLDQVKSNH